MKIFNIFVNRNLHQSFKRFVWRLEEDYVLRLGGIPTSKTLANWLARHRAPLTAIQPECAANPFNRPLRQKIFNSSSNSMSRFPRI